MSTAISTYSKSDYINFVVLMVLGFLVIPMTVSSDYWFTSILIPWLCLALATIGQQVIMGYTGQLALGAAGFIAPGIDEKPPIIRTGRAFKARSTNAN